MIDTAKLRELHEKATGGHWASPTANLFTVHAWDTETQRPTRCVCEVPNDSAWGNTKLTWEDGSLEPAANMRLICFLRNNVPAILAALERGEKMEKAAEEAFRRTWVYLINIDGPHDDVVLQFTKRLAEELAALSPSPDSGDTR